MARPVPVRLQVKEQEQTTEEHVPNLVQLRALPRELLLQQSLLQESELIQCFHCKGEGSTEEVERPKGGAAKVKELFERIDTNHNGVISRDELSAVFDVMGGDFKRSEIKALISSFDKDGDHEIDFDEFVNWLFLPGESHTKFRNDLGRFMLPKVVWLYQEGRGSWAVFDRMMAAKLNAAYAEGVGAAVHVKGRSFEYIMDLDEMVQINQKTGKERAIKRLSDGSKDSLVDWFVPPVNWYWICGRDQYKYEPDVRSALEAAWEAHRCGGLENPIVPMRVSGHVYEMDVAKMTQKNPKSGKVRKIRREEHETGRHCPEKPILIRMPSELPLAGTTCWVCRGSGKTSKFLKPFDDAEKFDGVAPDEGDLPDCLVCYTDPATYGVSTKCEHYFCDDCIRGSLQAMMESGQFPAFCPLCRAESGGPEPENGRIDDAALTFLQQRGVITKAFQFRFQKQQNLALEIDEPASFECPGKCGEFLMSSGPYVEEHKIGEHFDDPATGRVGIRLGECPSCNCFVCIKCEMRVPREEDPSVPPIHRCEGDAPVAADPDEASLELMAKIGKKCPKCGNFIEKNAGCHIMMCGDAAHGRLKNCIKNGGCCASFDWNTMAIVPDRFFDMDDAHKGGPCVTARQVKGHPKCARPECPFFKTADALGGNQGKNNGGDFCCDKCRENGTHQVFCHQMTFVPS